MSIKELIRTAKAHITGEPAHRHLTRTAFRAEDTPADLIAELAAADYSRLSELHSANK